MARLALPLALVLFASSARAQTAPTAPPAAVAERSEREVCDAVEAMLAASQFADARALLDDEIARRGVDLRSTSPLAVLRRLTDAMEQRAAPALPPPPPTAPPAPTPAPTGHQDDRTTLEAVSLYATTVSYGLVTGAWLNAQFDISDLKAAPWIPLVGAGAGVVAAYLADNPRAIRRGVPTAMGAGLTLGLLGGAALGVQGWRTGQWGVPTMGTVVWTGATVGLGAGVGLALLTDAQPGVSSFVLSGGFWGAVLGFMTAYAVDDDKHFGSFALAGEAIGVAASAATAGLLHPTHAQVRWMDLGVLAGGLVGTGLGMLLLREERAPFAATVQLGMIGGGVAGFLLGASRGGNTQGASGLAHGLAMHPAVVPLDGGAMLLLTGM